MADQAGSCTRADIASRFQAIKDGLRQKYSRGAGNHNGAGEWAK